MNPNRIIIPMACALLGAGSAPAAPARPSAAPIPPPAPPRPGSHTAQPKPGSTGLSIELPAELPSLDGSGNNLAKPTQGTPGAAFIRLAPAAYADGASAPSGAERPSARAISNAVAAQTTSVPNKAWATDMLWQWGQFLDHDLDLTLTANPAEEFSIPVPLADPQFDPTGTGSQVIPMIRSTYVIESGVREQTNGLSAYIDASQVYGSDASRAMALRRLDGSGKLKTSASDHGDLLPYNVAGLPNAPAGANFFVAGDLRVNEQVGLITLQTLFMREHNWWAERFSQSNPDASENEIYDFARLVVGAEMQTITYREFLPILLGPNALPPYRGYQSKADASISNEFATAAYRLGHSLLSPTLRRLNAQGQTIPEGDLSLRDSFFNLAPVEHQGIDPILRGLCTQVCQDLDHLVIDDVRNFLFGAPGAGGFDLASLNLQRGRDHGLGSLNQVRRALGMRPYRSFAEIHPAPHVSARLAATYAHPDLVDLWIGGLAEADVPGALIGPTFHRILVDQFTRSRDGDRFWYQSHLPPAMVSLVEGQNLRQVILRNTRISAELRENIWVNPPPIPRH